jgi:hypothetical protein
MITFMLLVALFSTGNMGMASEVQYGKVTFEVA